MKRSAVSVPSKGAKGGTAMKKWTRRAPLAGALLVMALVAGCAASPGQTRPEDAQEREITQASGIEPAIASQVDRDGAAEPWLDPDAPVSNAGNLAPGIDPNAPVSARPDPDPTVGSGRGPTAPVGSAGSGFAGVDPGAPPTAPVAGGAGSGAFVGIEPAQPLQQCGEDKYVHGEGQSPERRKCLWDAYLSNRSALFRTVAYTTEGDPITYDVSVQQRDSIAVRIDSQDRFGTQGQFAYTCTAMDFTDSLGFVLRGCTASEPNADGQFLTEDGELHIP